MKRSVIYKILGGAGLLLFLVYLGIQISTSLVDGVKTVEANMFTALELVSGEGVFIRSQTPVLGESSVSSEYLAKNGQKVSRSQEVAIFFDSANALAAYAESQNVDEEMQSLSYVYKSLDAGTDASKLDALVYRSMLSIGSRLDEGDPGAVTGEYKNLRQLVVSRGVGQMSESDYQTRLSALNTQKVTNLSKAGTSRVATAENAGYFIQGADGYETVFTPDALDSLTADTVRNSQPDANMLDSRVVGTVVDEFEWYFAAILDKADALLISGRKQVEVYFPQMGRSSVLLTLHDIRYEEDEAVVILKSGIMQEEYLTMREATIDIVIRRYEGLKVPHEALRQVDGKWGVYCLNGGNLKFKEITWIYQTESYYLVEPAEKSSAGLFIYDQIILNRKNIENIVR